MIGSLRGVVIDREVPLDGAAAAKIVVEVAGVGYRVATTADTVAQLPVDDHVLLHIHHHYREIGESLYGFLIKEERLAFESLLSAHGVGPALALAVLSTHPVERLAKILADDDLKALCEVPGVGKKTAQRLLVELKSTLVLPVLDGVDDAVVDLNGHSTDSQNGSANPLVDVREALTNLGYSSEEIRRAMAAVADKAEPDADPGRLLQLALLSMGNG
jgi:Holliday junction DNA helicase RuvA